MYKKLLFILFSVFIGVNNGYTQKISFQLFRVNPCTNITALDTGMYYLVNLEGDAYKSDKGTVWLDNKGTYNLFFPRQRKSSIAPIIITDSVNTHLHYDKRINIKYSIEQGGEAYYGCKGLLNGVHEDVYENGVVQMRGNFKAGAPKDSLTFFYPNGEVYQTVIFFRKKIHIREYDTLSVLSKITHVLDHSYFSPEYNATSYYPNGRVKKIEKVRAKFTRSTEYYPNKKIKNEIKPDSRIDYDEEGNVTAKYTWKNITYGKGVILYTTYEVIKTSFDKQHKKTAMVKYHSMQLGNVLPSFNVNEASYYVYWKQYDKTGNETVLLKNMSRREIVQAGGFIN